MERRVQIFEKIFSDKKLENRSEAIEKDITIEIKSSSKKETIFKTKPFSTTLLDILKKFPHLKSRKKHPVIAAEVNGVEWDLFRPLESSCSLNFLYLEFPFNDKNEKKSSDSETTERNKKAVKIYWHSCAHLLGACLEILFGAKLDDGPPLEKGFYYDCFIPNNVTVSQEDYSKIRSLFLELVSKNQNFQRVVISPEQAKEMFEGNKYKLRIIESLEKKGKRITAYRVGNFVDLCRGPHIPNTELVRVFEVTEIGAVHWASSQKEDMLQRVYGIAFPSEKEMNTFKEREKRMKELNHRVLGNKLGLFFTHKLSPGSVFWSPKGTLLYNRLVQLMRNECVKRGYVEISTPNMFSKELWEISGHAANYSENMFQFDFRSSVAQGEEAREGEGEGGMALKPMNCPGHCLVFASTARSYRELPLRFFEFGVLHRKELTGALSGLTRVIRFVQDDSHIFCAREEAETEIVKFLDFVSDVYTLFGFAFRVELSTRPVEKSLGGDSEWVFAESVLRRALESKFPGKWQVNAGDGAFYAPKIDFKLLDKIGREHQCATVQLDLQTARRFGLKFADKDNSAKTPAIVHRAVLGSLERFIAVLIEHFEGAFPFWLSPYQLCLVPLVFKGKTSEETSQKIKKYCFEVKRRLAELGVVCDIDDREESLPKKIVNAFGLKYCYVGVVGEKEIGENKISLNKGRLVNNVTLEEFYNKVEECLREHKSKLFGDF